MKIITPADGVYRDIPADEYFSWRAVSNSQLSRFASLPIRAHMQSIDTASLALGRAVHCAVLEPDRFAAHYRPFDAERVTKALRERYEAENVIGLSPAAFEEVRAMAVSAHSHPSCKLLLQDGEPEVSLLWTDSSTGLRCKARIDWLNDIAATDLKTTKDASPAAFAKAVANYRYHVQQAHYLAGCAALSLPASDFVFMAVEKAPPYPAVCYQLSEAAANTGFRLWRRDLEGFAKCQYANQWPAYPDEIQILSLPVWAMEATYE